MFAFELVQSIGMTQGEADVVEPFEEAVAAEGSMEKVAENPCSSLMVFSSSETVSL